MRRLFMAVVAAAALAFGAPAQEAWNPSKPSPDDIVIGSPDAPVTVVEYASLTCPHCARFHLEAWPEFKKGWIDTGKARLIYRHLPLDQSAMAGAMVVNCLPENKRAEALAALFASVPQWAPKQDIAPVLAKAFPGQIEFTGILSCISQEGLPERVMMPGKEAVKQGVKATPSFFVNGEHAEGFRSAAELGELVNGKLADELAR